MSDPTEEADENVYMCMCILRYRRRGWHQIEEL